jgi:hypothetical protein
MFIGEGSLGIVITIGTFGIVGCITVVAPLGSAANNIPLAINTPRMTKIMFFILRAMKKRDKKMHYSMSKWDIYV